MNDRSHLIPAVYDGLDLLGIDAGGPVAQLRLRRPAKRNAINDALIAQIHTFFVNLPEHVRAVVLSGEGEHFCAGLDLGDLDGDAGAAAAIARSRAWHAAFDAIQYGPVPVIAVLHGAVIGGGLELAAACHVRVAETSAWYALPEGQRGIFVGGGGSVRLSRLIGIARMTDMMLTGRTLDAEEGARVGLSQYLVPAGEGLAEAGRIAARVAANAPMSNFAVLQALPRIAELPATGGLLMEALMSSITQGEPEARRRVRDFLDGRVGKVSR
ncbi:crotonase/enoyl-CoA hydratase family protein [Derxia gummosa]|uniref:Crotonase/enoyl-CoA hydratase family protein n=1 Tax=Derxia gummosa DSM 723 TaxID=1121388 RepID=A0A8B6XCQ0_9BURK|nr:crotonase/enoyl-CoA hydratase family protein [Derxia gummosa]